MKVQKVAAARGVKKNNRVSWNYLVKETIAFFFSVEDGFFYTCKGMLLQPGKTIMKFLQSGRKKFQQPLSYFFIWAASVYGLVSVLFEKIDYHKSTTTELSPVALLAILAGLTLISYIIVVRPKYTYPELLVAFLFIYGTHFMVAPVILMLEYPFFREDFPLLKTHPFLHCVLTDLPLVAFIYFMFYDFVRAARLKVKRYIWACILGYIYYLLILYFFIIDDKYSLT